VDSVAADFVTFALLEIYRNKILLFKDQGWNFVLFASINALDNSKGL